MAKKKLSKNWIKEFNDDGMLRIDFMIPLMAQEPPEQLVAAFEDVDQETAMEWLDFNPKSQSDKEDFESMYMDQERDSAKELLSVRFGQFLAHVTTPVTEKISEKRNWTTFSWGYTYNKYIIGTSMEDIIEQAFKWRDSIGKKKKVVKKR